MKHFIRITQTDNIESPEMHEDKTDVKDDSMLSAKVTNIKNNLKSQMIAGNYKFQKHTCDHDESNRRGCKLEDI